MFIFHIFRLATLAKGALALSLVAGAYSAGNSDVQEYRVRASSAHLEATHEPTIKAQPTAKPETKRDGEVSTETTPSFEALLKECVARYSRAAENTKDACERAMAASGLGADAFWAKYRSQLVRPVAKTDKPATSPKPSTTSDKPSTTDPAVKECLAKYETLKTLKTGPAEAFEAALRAFNEKCRSLLVPSATKTDKPATTPKPASTVTKPSTTDPAVKECLARYEMLKTLKTGPAEAFEAALRAFNETCRNLLVPSATKPRPTEPKPASPSPKPLTTDPAVKECLARYETLKTLKTGPAAAFEAALGAFNETCKRVLEARR